MALCIGIMKKLKEIKNKKVKIIATLAFCALICVLWIFQTPCIIKFITGIPCPTCYITRGVLAGLRLDFVSAWNYHPMFWSIPVLYLYYLFDGRLFKSKILNSGLIALIIIGFLVNWGIRLFLSFSA